MIFDRAALFFDRSGAFSVKNVLHQPRRAYLPPALPASSRRPPYQPPDPERHPASADNADGMVKEPRSWLLLGRKLSKPTP
ncbi:MAG: hypothetical protein ABI162_18110 [Luteolibacter sp.]